MAKRKRLTPAQNLDAARGGTSEDMLRGPLAPTRAPIADVVGESAAEDALQRLSAAMKEARDDCRVIQHIPLDAIKDDYLVRDRLVPTTDDDDMQVLVASLKERGQQVAIEVVEVRSEVYGLISGWRRLSALRIIQQENPKLDTVLAIVRRPEDTEEAYHAMVEENEIRVDLSFYERARIVVKAVEAGVFRADSAALKRLFGAVTKSKRSKIKGFIPIVRALDGVLPYPAAVSEKQGLALSKTLNSDVGFSVALRDALLSEQPEDATRQSELITRLMSGRGASVPTSVKPSGDVHYIRDGLTMTIHKGGKVTLEGERMTEPHMLTRLKQALNNL